MNVKFRDLETADLVVGCTYEGGRRDVDGVSGKGGDPLVKLLGVSNSGGFRKRKIGDNKFAFVALVLGDSNIVWPNEYDESTGILKYYGDNREGTSFLSTHYKGNSLLKEIFDKMHCFNIFDDIPPFFAFQRTGEGHDVKFLGLAVPGNPDIRPSDDLILYKGINENGEEFINYEAYFTILDIGEEVISREWLEKLVEDDEDKHNYAPLAWKNFIEEGNEGIEPLEVPVVCEYKNRNINGYNRLYYGVPGSGKSHKINKKLEGCEEFQKERILFYPDYTYSDFVGQILPNVEGERIKYEFSPGPFTRILEKAFHDPENPYFLIIEEINRGNAPAIFGDIFQLLDRVTDENNDLPLGTSEFAVTNHDIADKMYNAAEMEKYGDKVRIPSNLYILSTMNTSDQNVFTLDTAFQRRWDMRLVENDWEKDELKVEILDTGVKWNEFCKKINHLILEENKAGLSSEDKRLGAYFVKEKDFNFNKNNGELSEEDKEKMSKAFAEKVLKYLWDDAFKFNRDKIFAKVENKDFSLEYFVQEFKNSNELDKFKIFNFYNEFKELKEQNNNSNSLSDNNISQD